MDFALTEEQTMICDAAGDFLDQVSDSQSVRAAMDSQHGFDEAVWRQLASELGWCAIPVAEEYGGLGLGCVEMALIAERMGEHLLCAPFFSTVCLAANVLQQTGSDAALQRFMPQIAAGEITASLPLPSVGSLAADGLQARRDGDHWFVTGECARVPDGASADWLFVFAQVDGQDAPGLFALPAGAQGLSTNALDTWDATRRFARTNLEGASAHRCDEPPRVATGMQRSLALARLTIAAEGVGIAQRCLDLTVAYVAERKQFGRPVGGFQAVKHRAAKMMVRCETARSAVYGAAALASGEAVVQDVARECAMARTVADDAAFYCAAEAIQLHGGVGFTWEYDPQLYFKRAQAARHWLGDAAAVRAEIADQIMGTA